MGRDDWSMGLRMGRAAKGRRTDKGVGAASPAFLFELGSPSSLDGVSTRLDVRLCGGSAQRQDMSHFPPFLFTFDSRR